MSITTSTSFSKISNSQNNKTWQTIFLSETSAIAEWFSAQQQRLGTMHLDGSAVVDYCYWKNFAETTFMPHLALKQSFSQLAIQPLG